MYEESTIAVALEALELGFTTRQAAYLAGVSRASVVNWSHGRLPHPRRPARRRPAKMAATARNVAEEAPMPLPTESEKRLYEPPRSGPLAGLEPSQIENLLLRAVLADLKADESSLASISNRSKAELGERLRAATGLPLRSITGFLRISKSSYEYHRARLGRDKYARLRAEVAAVFEEGGGNWGYRTVWARLRRSGTRVSEKVVRRVMREEGLVRSMSAKGCSPDNSACEGFFGRLKNEFFYYRDWGGVGVEEFVGRLDAYLRYYCEGRIKRSLGWLSPDEYRRSLGYAV